MTTTTTTTTKRPRLIKPRANLPRIIVPDSVFSIASYPTKLETFCTVRNARIVVPSYSLPSGTTCPGAVYTPDLAGKAAVCKDCYAEKLLRLRANVRDSHAARLVDVTAAARAWAKHSILSESDLLTRQRNWVHAMRLHDARSVAQAAHGDTASISPLAWARSWSAAVPPELVQGMGEYETVGPNGREIGECAGVWASWAYRVTAAMVLALTPQTDCTHCIANGLRIRWHMSGDIFSEHYANMLRLVFMFLLNKYPTLNIWVPTRNWHDGTPTRVRGATVDLARLHDRLNVVASGLHVGEVVGEGEDAWAYRSRTAVVDRAGEVGELGDGEYVVCHAQTESPDHTCRECDRCYRVGTRVAYVKH